MRFDGKVADGVAVQVEIGVDCDAGGREGGETGELELIVVEAELLDGRDAALR